MEVSDPRSRDYYAAMTHGGQLQVISVEKDTLPPEEYYSRVEKMSYGEYKTLCNRAAQNETAARRKKSQKKSRDLFWLLVTMGSREAANGIGSFLRG